MRDSKGHTTDSMTTFFPVLGGSIVFFYIFFSAGGGVLHGQRLKQGNREGGKWDQDSQCEIQRINKN